MTKREPIDVFLVWLMIGSLFLLALCVLVLSPLAYLWLMGIGGILMTFSVTGAAVASLTQEGDFIDFLIAGEVFKLGFQVFAAILAGLAEASK